MSTANPKNFDQRMEERQEQEMVEDIWMAVDQHANISPEFTQKANYFRTMNFSDARRLVADEIARGKVYVPDHLIFQQGQSNTSQIQGNMNNRMESNIMQQQYREVRGDSVY